MGFFSKLIGTLCAAVVVTGAVVCAVPETRTQLADLIADKFSPAYAEIKNDNAKKDSQIKDLNKDIDSLNKSILERDTSIAQKDKLIAEKDSLINTQTEQLNTCNANIKTLSSQKVTLLTAVSEIDNKINSTTDSVELEDLETRKTAILAQIDTLNTQISTLQTQKTQLEQDIATLQQEKATLQAEVEQLKKDKAELENQVKALENSLGISLDYNYFSMFGLGCRENKIGTELPANFSLTYLKYWAEHYSNSILSSEKYSRISFSYNGHLASSDVYTETLYIQTCEFYKNNVLIENPLDYFNTFEESDYQIYFTVNYLTDDNTKLSVKLNLVDEILTGKYISSTGAYVDFDNSESMNVFNGTMSGKILLSYDFTSDSVCLKQSNYLTSVSIPDDKQTIIIDGIEYKKVTSTEEPTTPTTSLTWKLNETLEVSSFDTLVNFTSNGVTYDELYIGTSRYDIDLKIPAVYFGSTCIAHGSEGDTTICIPSTTLTFESEPTGELLTWLEANATRVTN